MMRRFAYLTALALTVPVALPACGGAAAKDEEIECGQRLAPDGVLAPWSGDTASVIAATDAGGSGAAAIEPGVPAQLTLHPLPQVRFASAPERPPESGTAGLLSMRIETPGTYRIALGMKGWIDLIADGALVPSAAHGMGEPCGEVHKYVDFTLAEGSYIVQLSSGEASETRILAVRLPAE